MNLVFLVLILLMGGCAGTEPKSQDVSAARLQLNQGVASINGLDSILCRHPYGSEGIVYFDELLWTHLSTETKQRTVECLDQKRNLRVRHPAPQSPPVRVWSARIEELNSKLDIGWLRSDCPACDLDEKTAQYRLRRTEDHYQATEIPSGQIWR